MIMASSSFSVTPQVKFEVFLSFRGEDTRNNFTSHLYGALCRKKITTFIDDQLVRGDETSSSLLNTIKASKISLIIFSENYADSRWCLRELEEILDCKRTCGQIAIPVFYHVDPSDIRTQTGAFGKAFAKLQERFEEKLEELKRWQSALEEAGNLSGWTTNNDETENVLIEKIVRDILSRLNKLYRPSDNRKDLVGVELNRKKIESLLCIGSNGVRIVGIWGIGGIGKTTLSHVIFHKISSQFEGSCFVKNVREASEKSSELFSMKKQLFSTLLEDSGIDIERPYTEEMLHRKKVLIVFDDVTCLEQIRHLIRDLTCLHSGSRIIITSRNKQVLKSCGVKATNIYEVIGLCDHDALQLFSNYAFRQNYPIEDFVELSEKIVAYTKGVPLALKVLGSCLLDKEKEHWESEMDKLGKLPHKDIHEMLKISYDGLDVEDKSIFLDIACFFKGWKKSLVQDILDANYLSILSRINSLIDKSLITISYHKKEILGSYVEIITMHDLLQEMGKEIVRQESPLDPGKRSRLWHYEDINNVLQRNMGTEAIQGISLDMYEIKSDITLNSHVFAKMYNLRFFNVYNSNFKGYYNPYKLHGFEDLDESFSTKVFMWDRFPLKSLELKFEAENLVRLQMRGSRVEKLWNGIQNLVNLKHIDLGGCKYLTYISNLSKALNLQELILDCCVSLLEINSSSIENLKKLVKLNLSSCKKLISLPDFIQSKSIILCHCSELKMAPKISCKVEKLDLRRTAIEKLPFIEDQPRLVNLDLSPCLRLKSLSSSICKCKLLQYLSLDHFSLLERVLDDFGNLKALEILKIDFSFEFYPQSTSSAFLSQGRDQESILYRVLNALLAMKSLKRLMIACCKVTKLPDILGQLSFLQDLVLCGNYFGSIPSSIKDLSNLRILDISGCQWLSSLPELPRGINVEACGCLSLESISDVSFLFSSETRPQTVNFFNCYKLNISEILHKETRREICDSVCYPGNEIPKWFSIKKRGSYIILEQPPDWKSNNFLGFNMCAVVALPKVMMWRQRDIKITSYLYIKTKNDVIEQYKIFSMHFNCRKHILYPDLRSNHVFLGFGKSIEEPLDTWGFEYEGYKYKDVMEKMRNGKVLIEFNVGERYGDRFVKECGVHFLYAQGYGEPGEGSSSSFNSSISRSPQLCLASPTCDGQSSSFSWDLNELSQDTDRPIDVNATTKPSLEHYNGAELSGSSGCSDVHDEPQPKRLKEYKFF